MKISIFENKKILFYGPADTEDKKYIDVNNYDFVIITNRMLEIFFNRYKDKLKCNIISMCNNLFSRTHVDIMQKYEKRVDYFFLVNTKSFEHVSNYIVRKKLFILPKFTHTIGLVSLGLSKILNILKNVKFDELYITGCTIYCEKNIKSCYENGYMIPEAIECNIFNMDKDKHNIQKEIKYVKKICKSNKKIILCDELKKRIYESDKQHSLDIRDEKNKNEKNKNEIMNNKEIVHTLFNNTVEEMNKLLKL